MCGIAGIIRFNNQPIEISELKKMTDIISHRGPDGEGHWVAEKGNVGFGHRRLSIIDLSENGRQPMHYLNNRYTITFNGEIYNYIELKESLKKANYNFVSDCDTEVLLALYDQKKEKCLQFLDGMFSFAIWDEVEQELFCARDRFGEKPFYYIKDQNQFLFGSEMKEFWALGIPKDPDEQMFQNYIHCNALEDDNDSSKTFYRNIVQLKASHYATIKNGILTTTRYYSLNTEVDSTISIKDAAQRFEDLLLESVKLRLRSDVAVGSSLSGGLDSSSIVALINKIKGKSQKQTTFSARFKNYEKDEGKYIEQVLKICDNVEAFYTWPDGEQLEKEFDKLVFHQEEPFGSASIFAQYKVMELAKKEGVTVLLDGQGADEQLGGYIPYFNVYLQQLFYHQRHHYGQQYEHYMRYHGESYPLKNMLVSETTRMKLGRFKRQFFGHDMPIQKNGLRQKLMQDTQSIELQSLLRYADRNSMAHSREVRLPFLSHKLVEFTLSLPDEFKMHDGWTKLVQRKAMEKHLPENIIWRVDKIGYEPPQANWLNSAKFKDETQKAFQFFDLKEFSDDKKSNDKNLMAWRVLLGFKLLQ